MRRVSLCSRSLGAEEWFATTARAYGLLAPTHAMLARRAQPSHGGRRSDVHPTATAAPAGSAFADAVRLEEETVSRAAVLAVARDVRRRAARVAAAETCAAEALPRGAAEQSALDVQWLSAKRDLLHEQLQLERRRALAQAAALERFVSMVDDLPTLLGPTGAPVTATALRAECASALKARRTTGTGSRSGRSAADCTLDAAAFDELLTTLEGRDVVLPASLALRKVHKTSAHAVAVPVAKRLVTALIDATAARLAEALGRGGGAANDPKAHVRAAVRNAVRDLMERAQRNYATEVPGTSARVSVAAEVLGLRILAARRTRSFTRWFAAHAAPLVARAVASERVEEARRIRVAQEAVRALLAAQTPVRQLLTGGLPVAIRRAACDRRLRGTARTLRTRDVRARVVGNIALRAAWRAVVASFTEHGFVPPSVLMQAYASAPYATDPEATIRFLKRHFHSRAVQEARVTRTGSAAGESGEARVTPRLRLTDLLSFAGQSVLPAPSAVVPWGEVRRLCAAPPGLMPSMLPSLPVAAAASVAATPGGQRPRVRAPWVAHLVQLVDELREL